MRNQTKTLLWMLSLLIIIPSLSWAEPAYLLELSGF